MLYLNEFSGVDDARIQQALHVQMLYLNNKFQSIVMIEFLALHVQMLYLNNLADACIMSYYKLYMYKCCI